MRILAILESAKDLDFMLRIFSYDKAWSSKPSSCQLARENAKLDEKRQAQKIQVFGKFKYILISALFLTSCSQKEEEIQPDYDNMVMAEPEEILIPDEERDRKVIAEDLPDPQEQILVY